MESDPAATPPVHGPASPRPPAAPAAPEGEWDGTARAVMLLGGLFLPALLLAALSRCMEVGNECLIQGTHCGSGAPVLLLPLGLLAALGAAVVAMQRTRGLPLRVVCLCLQAVAEAVALLPVLTHG